VTVSCGGSQAFTITPASCYAIADVLVDGSSVGAAAGYTFTNVTASHTIAASFALKTYTVTASAGAGGTISPSGATVVNCGGDQAFTVTAGACYQIAEVLVDGVSVGAVSSYTFTDVQANHAIAASFVEHPLVLSETHVDVNCFGGSTGAIDLTVSGGTAPYSYLWSTGAISEDLSALVAGNYSVTVTDARGCTASQGVTIAQAAAALAVGGTHVDVGCFGGSTGSIDLTVSGGTAPYS